MTVALTWTESITKASQIESYQVWRAVLDEDVEPVAGDFAKVFEVEVERDAFGAITNSAELYSYEDDATPDSVTFVYYYVVAVAVQGPRGRSDIIEVVSTGSALFGPFTCGADYNPVTVQNDIAWSEPISVAAITNYIVQRSIDGGAYATIATLANNVFSYSDDRAGPELYAYRIHATRPGGTRDSNIDFVPVVAFPGAFTLSGSYDSPNNEFDLLWDASTGDIDAYLIERSVNGGAFVQIDSVSGITLDYTDDDPTIDRSANDYDYRVLAADVFGQETASNTLNFPAVAVQRVVLTSTQVWQVPAGVTEIDILCVGGGGMALRLNDTADFGIEQMAPGGGGGGVVVTNGVAVTPLDDLAINVGTFGASTFVQNSLAVELAQAGGGGYGAPGTSGGAPAVPGTATNGSGGGGNNDIVFGPLDFPPSAGDGTGNAGGTAAVGVNFRNHASGGGGGAGAAGGNGVAGIGAGNHGVPGVGGAGVIPPPSAIGGAWGTDIGENGFFGGGGGGSTFGDAGPVDWVVANSGVGNGADNTGGGARTTASPAFNSIIQGFSGIVVIYYVG